MKFPLSTRLCKGNRLVAYRFILKYKEKFGLRWLLRRMDIHVNAYYNFLKGHKKEYHLKKENVLVEIKKLYHETGGILGHRSMQIFLQRKNFILSKTTVHKYMNKELELTCVCRRKSPGYKKGNAHELFPNLLNQEFHVSEKNKVWCADFTYLKLTNGTFRYNCSILDLHERCVIATQTDKWMTSELAIETLKKALSSQAITGHNLIFHTYQGCHYTSYRFIQLIKDSKLRQSMSRRGNCWDNAPQESFFGHIKDEIELSDCIHFQEVKVIIDDWIHYYNNERYQWQLAKLAPNEYYRFITTGQYPLDIKNKPELNQ